MKPNDPSSEQPVIFHTKSSALAVWSLVLGILSIPFNLLCLGLPFAIISVICGHKALSRIRNSGGLITGDGVAVGGLVTGYLGIGMSILVIPMVLAIAIPNFVKARETSMQNACINNLRQIDAAKNQWSLEHNKTTNDTPTVNDLTPYFKDGKWPVCPKDGSYTIGKIGDDPTCSIPDHKLQ